MIKYHNVMQNNSCCDLSPLFSYNLCLNLHTVCGLISQAIHFTFKSASAQLVSSDCVACISFDIEPYIVKKCLMA